MATKATDVQVQVVGKEADNNVQRNVSWASEKDKEPVVKSLSKKPSNLKSQANDAAAGFNKGGDALREGLVAMIKKDPVLSEMGEIVAFSKWDADYTQRHADYLWGHKKFQGICIPCGGAGPACLVCWTVCLPCAAYNLYEQIGNGRADTDTDVRFKQITYYHIIFERYYVFLQYWDGTEDIFSSGDLSEEARQRLMADLPRLKIVSVTLLTGISDSKAIESTDGHMQSGIIGLCQTCFVPDMPGLLIKGPQVDGETFNKFVTKHDRHGAHQQLKQVETAWQRKYVCSAEQFAVALNSQAVWCNMHPPGAAPAQETMAGS